MGNRKSRERLAKEQEEERHKICVAAEATAKAGAEAAAKATTDLEVAKMSKEKAQVRDQGAYC